MSLYQTLKPLFLSTAAAVAVVTAVSGAQRALPTSAWAVVSVTAWIWVLTVATGVVFVLPVAPRLRRPPILLAAGWGTLTASAFVGLIFGRPYKLYGPQALGVFAAAGALAGVCYALLARRQPSAIR